MHVSGLWTNRRLGFSRRCRIHCCSPAWITSGLDRSGRSPFLMRTTIFIGLRNQRPDSAAAFSVIGNPALRIYVDRYSGRFLNVMDPSRRSYAWIYYALHTFQFPGLIEHPEMRTVLVLALLALGFTASATGVVLSIKRLRREFA